MIVFGWGKVTKRFIGGIYNRTCRNCSRTSIWQLCIMRVWFTLFFIPIVPYKKKYQIACPNCGSYIELTQAQFEEMKTFMLTSNSGEAISTDIPDSMKYAGKTEAQINYLKLMEEYHKTQGENR